MSLWIQHGAGKGDKIERVAAAGATRGVVLSPANENRDTLRRTVQTAAGIGLQLLLDPQLYVHNIAGASARWHEDHGLDPGAIHWAAAPRDVRSHVRAVLAANDAVGLDAVIAPTCLQSGFADVWTPLALQYARATLDEAGGRQVYVSTVVDEVGALANWATVEEWLDLITALPASGHYLIFARPARSGYPPRWDASRLTNLLRLIYRLAVLNDYEVIWGYADIEGLLGVAVGATGFGAGWHYSLRQFSEDKWIPGPPGAARRQARRRIMSRGLLTAVDVMAEAGPLLGTVFRDEVFARRVRELLADPTAVDLADAQVYHLSTLGTVALELAGAIPDRLTALQGRLRRASEIFEGLRASGVVLPAAYQARLTTLATALDEFRRLEAV